MIKWLFSDIDGTILPYDRPFSPRTVSVLSACPVPLTLVSGRMPILMLPMISQLGLSGIHCGNNGAVIFNVEGGRLTPLQTFPIKVTTAVTVMKTLAEQFPTVHYCWFGFNHWFASGIDEGVQGEADYTGIDPQLQTFPDVNDEVLALLVIVSDQQRRKQIIKAIQRLQLSDLQLFWTGGGYLEMTSREAGKAAALRYVSQRYGFAKDELAAFGDGGNDLPMLEAAGWSVAVANAAPAVKQAASIIAPADVDDGVARQIEFWQDEGRLS